MNVCGGFRDLADVRVPQRPAGCDVIRDDVAAGIAAKQQSAGGGQQATTAATRAAARVRMPPCDLPGLRIDRRQEAPGGPDRNLFDAAEAHRTAWIGMVAASSDTR